MNSRDRRLQLVVVVVKILPHILTGTVDCVLTYCRSTLIDQTLLGSSLSFFKSRDIGVIKLIMMMMMMTNLAEISLLSQL